MEDKALYCKNGEVVYCVIERDCIKVLYKNKVYPNQHKDFERVLKIYKKLMPNYTLSGFGVTDKQLQLDKDYCEAAVVSWCRSSYTMEAIKEFISAWCNTNIHYTF